VGVSGTVRGNPWYQEVAVENDSLLTVKQVAERLQLNEKTIRRWIAAGKLRGVWLGTDRAGWRIRETEVSKLLQTERPSEQTRQLPLPREEKRAPKRAA
jgi:excisionase family DNA binding protein